MIRRYGVGSWNKSLLTPFVISLVFYLSACC
jgi:hypothetical protein